MSRSVNRLLAAFGSLLLFCQSAIGAPNSKESFERTGDLVKVSVSRDAANSGKLDMDLRAVVSQFAKTRGKSSAPQLSREQLIKTFAITPSDKSPPTIDVIIKAQNGAKRNDLESAGAKISFGAGQLFYATVAIDALPNLAQQKAVETVYPVRHSFANPPKAAQSLEKPPAMVYTEASRAVRPYTGKGVIVAIVDTGIDWKHPDFIREDGTSRILSLFDMTDTSFGQTSGVVGSAPPAHYAHGTVYTNEQINAALKGSGSCNAFDNSGHGTACAGIAAGNGRATANDVPAGTHKGVAPNADLLVVDMGLQGHGYEHDYMPGVQWVIQEAQRLGRPCVINLSLGSQGGAHDGNSGEEQMLSEIAKTKGVVICVAAGNEADGSFHAGGRFGPVRKGQQDQYSGSIELIVTTKTNVYAYFDKADDWGVGIRGLDNFLVTKDKKPITAWLEKSLNPPGIGGALGSEGQPYKDSIHPTEQISLRQFLEEGCKWNQDEPNILSVCLLPGRYQMFAFGTSPAVKNGRFDFYVPSVDEASFGKGSEHKYMVGCPGTAKGVITVGAYDFQNKWANMAGHNTYFNLALGEISSYSNPGYCRDGVVKPDIAAPATYSISSLSRLPDGKYCAMGSAWDKPGEPNTAMISRDGYHVAWQGTSAATPYVVGCVALMLEKNPALTTNQIRSILIKTSKRDGKTGGVPNTDFGYGKIDVDAALRATPTSETVAEGASAKKNVKK